MIIIIDTTDKECQVAIFDGQSFDIKKWLWDKDTGSEVLSNIEKLFRPKADPPMAAKAGNIDITKISAIGVNHGPGSFTGTRVGITIANTLGWSLNIPIIGFSSRDIEVQAKKIFAKLKSGKLSPNHFPTPIYEKNPPKRV